MAGHYDIEMDRAATFVKDLRWTIDGVPVNMIGYNGFLVVKPDWDSDVILFDLTSDNGEITFDSNGGIHLTCPAHETEIVKAGLYVYNLFVRTDAQVIRMIAGTWKVNPSAVNDYLEETA